MADRSGLLSLAVLGMAAYGVYSIGAGLYDLLFGHQLEFFANGGLVALGLLLVLASAFVRIRMPGGLALALSALLALQALALHNDAHWYGRILLLPQIGRGVLAGVLALMAVVGGRTAVGDSEAQAS